jgi:hypothetical protein
MKRLSTLRQNNRQQERGQGMVEFALLLPIFFALMLGIIDFGRAFFIYSEVSNAVREGIRFSAVNPYDCTGIRQRTQSTLSLTNIDDIDLTISFDDGVDTYFTFDSACSNEPPEVEIGDRVTVSARMQVNLLTAQILGPILQQTFGALPIEYSSSRTVVPEEGVETGPTTTPYPTATPPPGASSTPTSAPSSTPTNTPVPPPAPINFQAVVKCQNGSVDFSWTAVTGASSYKIMRVSPLSVISTQMQTSCNNCDNLGTSQTRTYYVIAMNDGGSSSPSNASTVTCGTGATDTATPTATATFTATPSKTPTPSATPGPTNTPQPTRTPAPTLTGSETATPYISPTPIVAPSLNVAFVDGYPSRKTTGPNKQFWVKVTVTNPVDYPVIDATVTIIQPASLAGVTFTHLGNGVYGLNGKCFSSSTNSNTFVVIRAERFSYTAAEVGDWTDNNPPSSICPSEENHP